MRARPGTREGPSPERSSAEDPLAADRRTLVIAVVAMLVLVAVGVASAALFTGSACEDIRPRPLAQRTAAGTDTPEIVDLAFPDLDPERREAIVDGVSELAGRLGPITGVASVPDAERLTITTSGAVAAGPRTTVLDDGGSSTRAVAEFSEPSVVVGGGTTLYALALMNEITDQVDALQPLDLSLEPAGDCLDTATVNVPFAFHLDAGDSELLLLRVEEDGEETQLELRGRLGSSWQAALDVPVTPPGVLGERLSAQLGEELVVASRRVIPGEEQAAVTALERSDGSLRWSVASGELPLDEPTWIEVLGVTRDTVVIALGDDERTSTRLVGLDSHDGSLRWSDASTEQRSAVQASVEHAHELVHFDGRVELRELDLWSGDRTTHGSLAVDADLLVSTPQLAIAARTGEDVVLVAEDEQLHRIDIGMGVLDVTTTAESSVVLLGEDGEDAPAVAVAFGAP